MPILGYIFLGSLILLKAFQFQLSTYATTAEARSPFNFDLEFPLLPIQNPRVQTIVLVNTVASEFELRDEIRASWANLTNSEKQDIKIEFMMGKPRPNQISLIRMEQESFNDLIVANITESYYSLSAKSMAMIIYKSTYYKDTKCMVKADSDNVLILRNFIRLCEESVAPVILGKCDVPRAVLRNTTKWAVPYFVYSEPYFPQFCSTGTYVLAGAELPKLLINAAMLSPFATSQNYRRLSEDVMITGILASKAGIHRRHLNGFSFFEIPEYFCRNSHKTTYSIHMVSNKNPSKYHYKMMQIEGKMCKWYDAFGVKRW